MTRNRASAKAAGTQFESDVDALAQGHIPSAQEAIELGDARADMKALDVLAEVRAEVARLEQHAELSPDGYDTLNAILDRWAAL